MNDRLKEWAIFGGEPTFREPRPFATLAAPSPSAVLATIDRASREPKRSMLIELEDRLAQFHGGNVHCIAVTNACIALVMLMRQAAQRKRGNVIIPAFSYSGLPHLTQWAGQVPKFSDVNEKTHALDSRSVYEQLDADTTSILAVCNVQDTGYIGELSEVSKATSVPIIFDSVNALGATFRQNPLGKNGFAEVFSLHATKMLNGFEGGYITTEDDDLAKTLRQDRSRIGAYVSELHCAMACLSLGGIESLIARNKEKIAAYKESLDGIRGLELLKYEDDLGERYNYSLAIVRITGDWPFTRDETVRLMRAEGAMCSAYYSPPLHRSSHCPKGMIVDTLPVAESLSTQFMYLPSGEHTSLVDIGAITSLLRALANEGDEIVERLRALA